MKCILPLLLLIACSPSRKNSSAVSPADLNGYWQITAIGGKPLNQPEEWQHKKAFLHFDIQKVLISGSTGCNALSGAFTLEGSTLKFDKPIATTRMLCEGVNEQAMLSALDKVISYQIDGRRLELRNNDGVVMELERLAAGPE